MVYSQSVDASAGGTFLDGGLGANAASTRGLAGAKLTAAGAAATAVIKETDNAGRILAVLAAAIGTGDGFFPALPVAFKGKVFVTVTGAGATLILYET